MKKLILFLLAAIILAPKLSFAQSNCPQDPQNFSNGDLLKNCSIGELSTLSEERIMTFSTGIITQMSNDKLVQFNNDNLIKIGQITGDLPGFLNRFSNTRLLNPPFPDNILKQLPKDRIETFSCEVQQKLGYNCNIQNTQPTPQSTAAPIFTPSPSDSPSPSPFPKKPVKIIISQFDRSDQTLDPNDLSAQAKLNLNFDQNGVANVRFKVNYDSEGKDVSIYYVQYKLKQKSIPPKENTNQNVFTLNIDNAEDTIKRYGLVGFAQAFYEKYPGDNYDFIIFSFKKSINIAQNGADIHVLVKNTDKGTFSRNTDSGPFAGRFDKLKSVVYMQEGFKNAWVKLRTQAPTQVLGWVYFDMYMHELSHHWGVDLPDPLKDAMQNSGKDVQQGGSHFEGSSGGWVSADHDPFTKVVEQDGKYYFTENCTSEPHHSDFEMYSMGLKSPQEIKERLVTLISTGAGVGEYQCDTLKTLSPEFVRKTFSIQDFINVLGPRDPSIENAQKDFKVAFVYVTSPKDPPDQSEIDALNWISEKLPIVWYKSTEKRSTINGIVPHDLTVPAITNVTVATSTTENSIKVDWKTDRPSISFLILTDPKHGSFIASQDGYVTNPPKLLTSHSISTAVSTQMGIFPLFPNIDYLARIVSIDENYNMANFDLGKVKINGNTTQQPQKQTSLSTPQPSSPTSAPEPLKLKDFNGDGVVNVFDYVEFGKRKLGF